MKKFLSFAAYALLAMTFAFNMTSCGDDDDDDGGVTYDPQSYFVGKWSFIEVLDDEADEQIASFFTNGDFFGQMYQGGEVMEDSEMEAKWNIAKADKNGKKGAITFTFNAKESETLEAHAKAPTLKKAVTQVVTAKFEIKSYNRVNITFGEKEGKQVWKLQRISNDPEEGAISGKTPTTKADAYYMLKGQWKVPDALAKRILKRGYDQFFTNDIDMMGLQLDVVPDDITQSKMRVTVFAKVNAYADSDHAGDYIGTEMAVFTWNPGTVQFYNGSFSSGIAVVNYFNLNTNYIDLSFPTEDEVYRLTHIDDKNSYGFANLPFTLPSYF